MECKSHDHSNDGKFSRRQMFKGAGILATVATGPILLGVSSKSGTRRPLMGTGEYTYEVIHDWGELPGWIRYGNTHGVCVDASGKLYVHHSVHPDSGSPDSMVVFDSTGKFVESWGEEYRGSAHGLHIQQEDSQEFLYLSARSYSDLSKNVVTKTTLKGEVVFTLGYPSESKRYKLDSEGNPSTKYHPTNLAIAPDGDIYVADGYGSSYINQYNGQGEFLRTIGERGTGPGQLDGPHGITVDLRGKRPLLLVADRTNNRLQYFTLTGEHVKIIRGVKLPCHFHERGGLMLIPDLSARVTLMDRNDKVITHLGAGPEDWRERRKKKRADFPTGKFLSPHDACFDRKGNIFVVEWIPVGRVTKLRWLS